MLTTSADRLPAALAELEPGSRALLDLSLRRGVSDADIAELLRKRPDEVARGRDDVLELLADALGVDGDDRRARVRSALLDLPDGAWQPAPRPAAPRPAAPRRTVELPSQRIEPPAVRPSYAVQAPPRRLRAGAVVAMLLLIGVVAAITIVVVAGGDEDEEPVSPPDRAGQPAPGPGRGDDEAKAIRLKPLGGGKGKGTIAVQGDGRRLEIAVSGLPKPAGQYEIWLYDNVVEARSLGGFRDTKVELDARLPDDPHNYGFIDVSLEPADGNPNHSGDSVLRAPLDELLVR